jgi:hypothetical protein
LRVAFLVARFLAPFLAAFLRVAFLVARFFAAFFPAEVRAAFFTARFFVDFFAGGTDTTFLREHALNGRVGLRSHSVPEAVYPEPYATRPAGCYEFTRFLNSEPTVNFADLDAAIWIGSRVRGFIPVRA